MSATVVVEKTMATSPSVPAQLATSVCMGVFDCLNCKAVLTREDYKSEGRKAADGSIRCPNCVHFERRPRCGEVIKHYPVIAYTEKCRERECRERPSGGCGGHVMWKAHNATQEPPAGYQTALLCGYTVSENIFHCTVCSDKIQ